MLHMIRGSKPECAYDEGSLTGDPHAGAEAESGGEKEKRQVSRADGEQEGLSEEGIYCHQIDGDLTYKLAPAVAISVIVIGWRRRWSQRRPATTRPTCARSSSLKEEIIKIAEPTVLDIPAAEIRNAAS